MKSFIKLVLIFVCTSPIFLACKKHFTKGTIRVYDVQTGEGISDVSVTYNFTAFDRDLSRTDANGEIEVSGIGNLYDMEVNVFVPTSNFSTLGAYENCGNKHAYFFKEETLEIPLQRHQIVSLHFYRIPDWEKEQQKYCVAVIDTHCVNILNNHSGINVFFEGAEVAEGIHVWGGNIASYDMFGGSPYSKMIRVVRGYDCYDYAQEDLDTIFYIKPFTDDTLNLDLHLE